MGTLFARSSGIYYAVFAERGKRVWHSLRTRDHDQAKAQFDQLQTQYRRKGPLSILAFAEQFARTAELSLSQKTISMYAAAFKNLARHCGDRLLTRIFASDVEQFKSLRCQEVSPTSVNIELRTLRAAFSEAVRLKLITENPFLNTKFIRVPYKEGKFLTESEFKLLLALIKDPLLRDIVDFAVHTMMRLGEIMDLKWANVDCNERVIHIVHSEQMRVKGGKARTVPMASPVYELLKRRTRSSDYVFCNWRGFKLDGKNISRRFKRYVRKAGLHEGLHFHSLRHTGISWLINRGVPPQFIQRIAGHSSLAVTSVYSHVQDRNLIEAISVLRRHDSGGSVDSFVSSN